MEVSRFGETGYVKPTGAARRLLYLTPQTMATTHLLPGTDMPSDNRSKPQPQPQTDKIKDLPQKSSTSRDQQVKGGRKAGGTQQDF